MLAEFEAIDDSQLGRFFVALPYGSFSHKEAAVCIAHIPTLLPTYKGYDLHTYLIICIYAYNQVGVVHIIR